MRFELRGASGDQDLRAWPLTMCAADRLSRLADRFIGNRTAVYDNPVLVSGGGARDGIAFREVEATAERDRFDGHVSVSKSSSPLNTWVAAPRMRIGWPGSHEIVRLPPVMST